MRHFFLALFLVFFFLLTQAQEMTQIHIQKKMPLPKIEGQLRGIILRELLSALGLKYKVQNPYYQSRSVLVQPFSGRVGRLGAADIKALRQHYPR